MALQSSRRYLAALIIAGVPLLLASLPPFVSSPVRVGLMTAFASVCHQLPDRSFWIEGVQLAVCQRCYGIYSGLFLGVLLLPVLSRWTTGLYQRAPWLLIAGLLPATLDWGLQLVDLWQNTPLSRMLTGLWFGLLAGLILTATLCYTHRPPQPQPV